MEAFAFSKEISNMPKQNEYNATLHALMDARVVVLSVLDQIGIHTFKEVELREIIRKCAIDLVHQKPAIARAISPSIKQYRKKLTPTKSRSKISRT
jgi:hypothetical protein